MMKSNLRKCSSSVMKRKVAKPNLVFHLVKQKQIQPTENTKNMRIILTEEFFQLSYAFQKLVQHKLRGIESKSSSSIGKQIIPQS